jgi:hypothetical protein
MSPIMAGDEDNARCRWPCQSEPGHVAGKRAQKHVADRCQRSAQALAPRVPAVQRCWQDVWFCGRLSCWRAAQVGGGWRMTAYARH